MKKFDIDIKDKSVWVTATPQEGDVTMPFYIMEIGHFYAGEGYITDRAGHDSYMLIYTADGKGKLQTGDFCGEIKKGEAVVFDCRNQHYYSSVGEWEFFWIHIKGIGTEGILNAVNYNGIRTVSIRDTGDFVRRIQQMINTASYNDICSLSGTSANIHSLFNSMIEDSFDIRGGYGNKLHAAEIRRAVDYIEENYSEQITVEDITKKIHVSKYYFIRLFKQYMGMTPHSYLINYRINQSKILLRTETISIGEISQRTGFSDVSNFIRQFKRQTGQKPMEYRKRFSL